MKRIIVIDDIIFLKFKCIYRDDNGSVFIVERLVTRGGVDYGKPLVGQVVATELVEPTPVGTSVLQPISQLKKSILSEGDLKLVDYQGVTSIMMISWPNY